MSAVEKRPPWIVEVGSGKAHRIPVHRNSGLEIVYIEGGNLPWQVENQQDPVGPGSAFFTMPWQWHGSTADFEPSHSLYFVVLGVEGKCIDQPGPIRLPKALGLSGSEQRRILGTLRTVTRHAWPATAALADSMRALVRECTNGGPFQERRCAAWVAIVLTELEQTVRENRSAISPPGAQRVSLLIDELMRRLDERWTLDRMSAFCGLRRTQFTETLRLHTGDSPVGLINRLRIERARRLLRESSRSITDISMECGFESSQYFARVFRSLTGKSASGYRTANFD